MRKSSIAVVIPAILAVAGSAAVGRAGDAPPPVAESPEMVVFHLQYRGLTAPDDALSYRYFYGYGSEPPTDNTFVEAVKKQVAEFDLVHNGSLRQAPWSVVELKNKKPVALYFDLNGDGGLSDDERILPAASSLPRPEHEFAFITPDFNIRRDDGREVPFRVMLVANSYGGDRMNYMWSPCCILEGQATLAGESMRLLLYGQGFTGSFDTFGQCSFLLVPAAQKLEGYLSRATLSSLICHDGVFYRLSLEGSHEQGKTVQVTLRKDTSPTGKAVVNLQGKETLKIRLQNATITGAKDDTVWFRMENGGSPLPVGQYTLSSASTLYGAASDDEWQVNFSQGPDFTIARDETSTVKLGQLGLSVTAVDERQRYSSDVKETSTYAKGTPIYLAPQIKGKAGEIYMRFSQKADGNRWTDVKPHIAILDSDEKEVASEDMEYG